MLKISENIHKNRKRKNITQEQLAEYMMVTKASVSKWETGQSYPDILLLPKLASFFNITIDELIGYEPQLSTAQIRKIYESLMNEIKKENFEDIIEKAKSIATNYYSCYELLYYIGLFIVNHINLAKDSEKIKECLEYSEGLFIRVHEESDDVILINNSLNMRAVCLIQLGKPREAIEILPTSEDLFFSTNCLVASAYLQTKDAEIDKKLQIFIYKTVIDLVTLLTMKSSLNDDSCDESFKRTNELIETFNIKKLNVSLVLNFYLIMAKKYKQEQNLMQANTYIEKYLYLLYENEKYPFELKGDNYFNKISDWIDENLILGNKPARDIKIIQKSFLDAIVENKEFEELTSSKHIKEMIDHLKNKLK